MRTVLLSQGVNPTAKFYIFLTVHLRIILVSDQLDAQFLL